MRSMWSIASVVLLAGVVACADAPDIAEDPAAVDLSRPQVAAPDVAPPLAGEGMAAGALAAVDVDARTLTVRVTGQADPVTFTYDDLTAIENAQGVQGLAGMGGSRVTVYYRQDGDARYATRIVVR